MIDSDAQDSAEGLASEERTNEISPTKMKQKKQQLRQNQLIRENRRLRNSASFRAGKLFTRAATKPWLLPLLPFSILFLMFSIGMERLGRWPVPVDSKGMRATSPGEPRDCVMFFPTNGVGFGHFTRMYALAKRFKKYSRQQRSSFSLRCPPCTSCTTRDLSPITLLVVRNLMICRQVAGMLLSKNTSHWLSISIGPRLSFTMVPFPTAAC